MVQTVCAYCGQPLQVVAGFCTSCQAPVEIASHARLVARALREVHPPLRVDEGTLLPLLATPTPAALPMMPPAPMPVLPTRMLLCGGIVALALVVVAVSLRLGVNPIRALVAPAGGELGVSLASGGAGVTIITTGTVFILHYAITVEAASALVTLSITPDGLPTRSMTERWPRGITQRDQRLIAVTPGIWHIAVARDGITVRQLDLTVTGNPLAMTKPSSNPFGSIWAETPSAARYRPTECG